MQNINLLLAPFGSKIMRVSQGFLRFNCKFIYLHANVIKIYEHSMRSKFYYHIEHPAPIPTMNLFITKSGERSGFAFLCYDTTIRGRNWGGVKIFLLNFLRAMRLKI